MSSKTLGGNILDILTAGQELSGNAQRGIPETIARHVKASGNDWPLEEPFWPDKLEEEGMPRAKKPLKSEQLKRDLANALGEPQRDILTRGEVVEQLGKELGYTNEKSLSNAGVKAPCFYLAPLGTKGMALYSRRELTRWLCEPEARREMEKLMEQGRPRPWPKVVRKAQPSDTDLFLESLVKSAPSDDRPKVQLTVDQIRGLQHRE